MLDISTTDFSALCHGEATGEIHVVATGGTPIPGTSQNWTYELFPGPTTAANPIVGGTAIFTGLSTGIYTVTVTDFHGCDTTSGDIFVGEPDNDLEITIDTYDETCNVGEPPVNDAGATVYPTGGTSPYTVLWDNTIPATANIFELLTSGAPETHTVVVKDNNECMVTDTITLFGYQNVFLPDYATSYTDTFCMGDQIEINIDERPGLSYVLTMDKNGSIIGTTANLNVTSDPSWRLIETFTLTITDDATGCFQTVPATITIYDVDEIPYATVLVGGTNEGDIVTITEGTEITLSSNSGYSTYYWTNSDNEELATVREFSITPTNSDWYHIYVTYGNCIGYDSAYVAVGVGGTHIVDAISPDGDGFNDDWYIEDLNKYDNSVVQLFNRWGDMLFEYKGGSDRITNNDFDWESLSIGTYYYIIDLGDGSLPQTGPLTIIK